MEGGWPQTAASRPASSAVPTQDNAQKMVQDSGGETMDKRVEGRQEGRATYRHTPTPTKKVLQLHERLSKRESALPVQLQTKKIGLNDFLFN